MDQAKGLHQIIYTEIRRVQKGQRIFLGELISGGGDQPPWPSWTEGMLAPHDCIVYERSEGLLDDRVEAGAQSVECDPKHTSALDLPYAYRPQEYDDWGVIRDRNGTIRAHVRGPLMPKEADRHRRDKTDPYEAQGKSIVAALNSHYELLVALKRIMGEIPIRRDWLDPVTEAIAKDAIAKATRAGVVPE